MAEIIHLPQTHSTNQYLRMLSEVNRQPQEGMVVWADFQTAGRGQMGNSWESEADKNLLFSLMLCPSDIPARYQFIISQVVSLGIIDVLNNITPGFQIKWPNDIYFNNDKVAGILIENDLSGNALYSSIIGIGLNVNQQEFVSNAPNPISLSQITGKSHDREELLKQILERIFFYYGQALEHNWHTIRESYKKHLFRGTGFHCFEDDCCQFRARIHEINLMGTLVLEDEQGKHRSFAFKEVQFIL